MFLDQRTNRRVRRKESSPGWHLIGRAALAVLLVSVVDGVCAQPSAPAPATRPGPATQPQPAQIDRNGVLILVRSTLLAVQDANVTGNYTVLRDLGAPGFQAANTAVRLGEIFANLRAQNIDLSGVAVLEPQLTLLPQIEANGMMRMAGFFPSVPLQLNFELLFAPVAGRWRLFGISLGVGNASPAAPEAKAPDADPSPAAPAAAEAQAAKPAATPPSRPAPPRPAPRRPTQNQD